MQPMIAHEVQQQLESGVEDGLDSALLHAVAAPPPEIEPGDKYLHGVAMPNAVPSNGTRSKSNNNRSSSLHHYRIAEAVEGRMLIFSNESTFRARVTRWKGMRSTRVALNTTTAKF
eukprot:symbB.v1.2.016324.t1/scaffold1240.1/size129799/7